MKKLFIFITFITSLLYYSQISFDTTFGNSSNGKINFQGEGNIFASTLQSDNKILVSGFYNNAAVLFRFDENGNPDQNFGTAGKVIYDDVNYSTEAFLDICLQNDGKILVQYLYSNAISSNKNAKILRFNSDGTLDTMFNNNFVSNEEYIKLHFLPNGKITCFDWKNNQYQFLIDGSIDTNFGTNGIKHHSTIYVSQTLSNSLGGLFFVDGDTSFKILKIAIDGSILAINSTIASYPTINFHKNEVYQFGLNSASNILLRKYDNFLAGNTTYGSSSIPSSARFTSSAYQSDNKIIIAGGVYNGATESVNTIELVRFTDTGLPDVSFNTINSVKTPKFSYASEIGSADVIVSFYNDVNKKLYVISGNTGLDTKKQNFQLARFNLGSQVLGTNEFNTPEFKIFPNPTKDILNFNEIKNASVLSIEGKTIINDISGTSVNVQNLQKGIYILKVIDKQGKSILKKFIKE